MASCINDIEDAVNKMAKKNNAQSKALMLTVVAIAKSVEATSVENKNLQEIVIVKLDELTEAIDDEEVPTLTIEDARKGIKGRKGLPDAVAAPWITDSESYVNED